MKKITTILIVCIAIVAIIWHRKIQAAPVLLPIQNTASSKFENSLPNTFCPPTHAAKKNKNPAKETWATPDNSWKSYGTSFATHLTQFIGAQWAGENVGQVTCLYKSEQRFKMEGQEEIQRTLPVMLVSGTLSFQPTQGQWKHISRGVYNCYASNQQDCPFKMNRRSKIGNIYKEAESLKNDNVKPLKPPTF